MKYDKEFVKEMLERTTNEGQDLTDWENQFIESITDQYNRKGSLSDKQIDILERIYTEKVS